MNPPRSRSETFPIAVPLRAGLLDHAVRDRPVLSAVELLQALARVAVQRDSLAPVRRSRDARFTRFLDVPADAAALDALVELVPGADRTVAATLSTRRSGATSGVVPACDHAAGPWGRNRDGPRCRKTPC